MKDYLLIEKKYLEDEQSDALVFEHKITKAKIFVMKNDDNNKVFGIGFRTPPTDSTGVCHILEHSVLNGSKKYKTKEPFMDMIKGSLQTFLNAMTYPDKTIYPIASRNQKDFENLMDVYLDAVFNPRVKDEEKIFLQEGWRFHLNESEELEYKGVVYNEMKGAMSSPEDQVFENINKYLFPDTVYSLNSGGDPYEITNLKYSDFIEFYENYYHPSNSYIFLYGDLDYEEYLNYIHNQYLSKYEYRNVNSQISEQRRFLKKREDECCFNTLSEPSDNSSYISYSLILGKNTDSFDRLMANLVSYVLINNESSPLRKKLLELDIMEDIINASSSNLETSFSIVAKNIDVKNKSLFVDTVENSFLDIVENGIDKNLVKSVLNEIKFYNKEKGNFATKGVIYMISSFDTWLYDKSPIQALEMSDTIKYIEENLDKGIFEKYVRENIVENNHKSIVIHRAKLGMNQDKDKEIKSFLEDKWKNMSPSERDDLKLKNKEMSDFQNRKDTAEEKETIPMLQISDVNSNIKPIDREVFKKDNYTLIKHNLPTSGIDYLTLVFDASHIKPEELPYLSLLGQILGLVDTEKYNYSDLNTKIYLETGGISFSPIQYVKYKSNDVYSTFTVKTKFFSENFNNSIEILKEVIFSSKFNNEKRLKELIQMTSSRLDMSLFDSGHVIMMNRALSNHIKFYKYNELVNGIDYQLFIRDLLKTNIDEVCRNLEKIYSKVFNSNNLIIDIASDFNSGNELIKNIGDLVLELKNENLTVAEFPFTEKRIREAFSSSADVQYIALGNKLNEYDSKMIVLNNLISNTHLYNEIRAKGGAYGAGLSTSSLNNFSTFSYRDPNLKRTLSIYEEIPNYLTSLEMTEKDLLPFIIGAVGRFDPPMTEKAKAGFDLNMYIVGKTYSDLNEEINNALSANMEDLKTFSSTLGDMISGSSLAVLGNKSTIDENRALFDIVISL